MLCIFCLKERPSTEEHIFPLAIGGTVTTDRVCESCNSGLGSRVDAALSDFFPIRARRAKLGLAGNGGEVPGLHEFFLGMANLVGVEANQVHTAFNKSTGKLDLKQIPHKSETTLTSGETSVQITVDARDRGKLPKMIQRERTLRNLPPLPEEELANAVNNFAVNSVENPVVHITRAIDFKYLRHAICGSERPILMTPKRLCCVRLFVVPTLHLQIILMGTLASPPRTNSKFFRHGFPMKHTI